METKTNLEYSGHAKLQSGINMYYEIHGTGEPLVLIHGGGSTIETTFGRVLNLFSNNRKVIAVELQGHGRTADIDRSEKFEQDADDVASLMEHLKIEKADFFGFSNGGNTAMQIALHHPEIVRKLVLASTFFKREGLIEQLWQSLNGAVLNDMPAQLQEVYLKIAPEPKDLIKMFEKDRDRMIGFKSWNSEDIRSITAPAFIIIGDRDVVKPEHAVEMYRTFPNTRLSILPGLHGEYIGEITTPDNRNLQEHTFNIIEEFLNEPNPI